MTFFSTNNFLLMKLLPIHCSWGAPFSEKRPKLQVTDYITKKVDFRNNGFRAKMRHVWRLASWGMAFLLKQVCSRTTFVYHKKSEWERYKTYPVEISETLQYFGRKEFDSTRRQIFISQWNNSSILAKNEQAWPRHNASEISSTVVGSSVPLQAM